MASSQTFHDHIKEFRRRFLVVMLVVLGVAGIAYVLRTQIIEWLQHPLGIPLYYTSPAGSFNFVMQIAFIIGIFAALPVAVYHLLRFIEPALPMGISRGLMAKVIGSSFLLAVAGICFGYFIMLPMSLHFFAGYSSEDIKPLINADQYLKYVINNLLIFALTFQLPLIALFINRIKPLKPSKLLHYQRHVISAALIFAVLLPFTYEPVSQFIVAAPIVGLYYFSIVLIAFTNWRFNKKQSKQKPAQRMPFIPPTLEPAWSIPKPLGIPSKSLKPAMLHTRSTDGIVTQAANNIALADNKYLKPAVNAAEETPKPTPEATPQPAFRPIAIDGISRLLTTS